jgi:hypothetical protein
MKCYHELLSQAVGRANNFELKTLTVALKLLLHFKSIRLGIFLNDDGREVL